MGRWRVKPKGDGQRWLVTGPNGNVTEFVTGGLAIKYGKQQAQKHHEILEVFTSVGRVFSTEDYRLL